VSAAAIPPGAGVDPDAAREEKVDKDLGQVAKILAAAFTAVAGFGTAFGLSQDALLIAVKNYVWVYICVAIFALVAIALSICSLFFNKTQEGNRSQAWLLAIGTFFYLLALLLTIIFVAQAATTGGRPNIADVTIERGSDVKMTFTVKADRVADRRQIVVEVDATRGKTELEPAIYRALLRPDRNGNVEQKVSFRFTAPAEATGVTIRVRPEGDTRNGANCDGSQTEKSSLGCVSAPLPK
jgi:uncharacterized protein (DUF58 family)